MYRLPHINFSLLFILGIVLFLRLPSLFEPNWYGDEQIYLTIGQTMKRGAILYRDIWDNKPPLLYALYAIIPTLLWAKMMATFFVLGTCVGVYSLTKKILSNDHFPSTNPVTIYSSVSTLVVGVLLSIPLFEGTIANAELFFTLPIVWGGLLIFNFQVSNFKLAIIGLLMAVAFLFKVPAVFDFVGMFLFLLVLNLKENFRSTKKFMLTLARTFAPISITFIIFITIIFGYFYLNFAIKDFVIASFLQNASYVSVDTGPLSKLSNPLFIKALILVASCLLLMAGYFKKLIPKELLFLALWLGFSLYGALLSGRPYAHYLLQIVPPVIILTTYLMHALLGSKKPMAGSIVVLFALAFMFFNLFQTFEHSFTLPTMKYYQNFYDYISERKLWPDYATFFDSRTPNSYAIAKYIIQNTNYNDPIFVWGDAAGVYVLSERKPATKFIQAHHLTTVDPKNYDLIIEKLKVVKPKYIIIKRQTFTFPKLEELVTKNYQEVAVFKDLHVYKIVL